MRILKVCTTARIKGYVQHENLIGYIREKYDSNASDNIKRTINCSLLKYEGKYSINEHSDDNKNWYSIGGYITFRYNNEDQKLFYLYDNINSYENMDYYKEHGLKEMVEAETTYLSLDYGKNSVEIVRSIIEHFGYGWLDENDSDAAEHYYVHG